jgi:hypothetical protein
MKVCLNLQRTALNFCYIAFLLNITYDFQFKGTSYFFRFPDLTAAMLKVASIYKTVIYRVIEKDGWDLKAP